jgi:hypothetical protein
MSQAQSVCSRPGAPPVVAILPALEVVISVRLGDGPRPCQLLREVLMLDPLLMPVRPDGGVLLLPLWDDATATEWLQRFNNTTSPYFLPSGKRRWPAPS